MRREPGTALYLCPYLNQVERLDRLNAELNAEPNAQLNV
jgi:hypothetical protein